MNEKKQQIINFEYEKNFKYEDFYISKSNQHILDFSNCNICSKRTFSSSICNISLCSKDGEKCKRFSESNQSKQTNDDFRPRKCKRT